MAYVTSVHKASSVRHALRCNFLSPDEPSLIVAKSNRAEIYAFGGDGLSLRSSFTVYGRITGLVKLRPASSATDHLFVATDRYEYFTVSWNAERGTIQNERKARDVVDLFSRDSGSGPLYLVDPGGRMLAMHIYEGLLLVMPITRPLDGKGGRRKSIPPEQIGNLEEHAVTRIAELKVRDMAFLHTKEKHPTLAILHGDSSLDSTQLITYQVVASAGSCDLKEWHLKESDLDNDANILIPVEDEHAGVLVVSGRTIQYFPDYRESAVKKPLPQPTVFCAWGVIDKSRFVLGDDLGSLLFVTLLYNDDEAFDIKVEALGKTSTASRLVYLDNGHIYVGSHYGDSQVVRLSPQEPYVETVQTFANLAPILDFRILNGSLSGEEQNLHSSGQSRIVTASGGFRNGGLRAVKSGVGLEDSAILGELEGVRGVWAVQSNPDDPFDNCLVISFVDETRVFQFDGDGEVEELEQLLTFTMDEETLLVRTLPRGRLLQVTPSRAKVIDSEGGTVVGEVKPPAKIGNASANDQALVCSIGGRTVTSYDLNRDLEMSRNRVFDDEVACLFVSSDPASLCAVGFWNSSSIALLLCSDLGTIVEQPLSGENDGNLVPRDVFIGRILEGQPLSLLVAMGEGTMYSFSINADLSALSQKKAITLGAQAFSFHSIPRENGTVSVFAACDQPSLIYGDDGHLLYSTVTAEKVSHLHYFNSRSFPSSVAVMVAGELKISTVDTAHNIHVGTLKIGDVVRRLAHSPSLKVFGVVTISIQEVEETGAEYNQCYVRVIDEANFSVADSYALEPKELVEAIACIPLDSGDGTLGEKFVVGTSYEGDSDEAKNGRILIFDFVDRTKIVLTAELKVTTAVKAIDSLGNKLVAAMNKTVEIYSFRYQSAQPQLKRIASYRSHSEPIDLGVCGNTIAVGDLMKGPSLLQYSVDEEGNDGLTEISRTYRTSWTTAVEMWDENTVISSDSEGNITIYEKGSAVAENQKRLQTIADVRVGEMINRIRRVEIQSPTDRSVTPKAYFATVDGSIYLLGEISKSHTNLLMQLQANLAKVIKGIGDLDFMRYRAFATPARTEHEPNRFVDGDFIERFLELPDDRAESVIKGVDKDADALEASVEEVRTLIETLKRLH